MASKRRIRRRSCGSKEKFPSHDAAVRVVRIMRQKGKAKGPTSVYRCEFCGCYHWGHHSPRDY